MLISRIIGVFKLDVGTFEAIEHDPSATAQAALVVAIVAILSAFGSAFGAVFSNSGFFNNFVSALLWTFIGWLVWSLISYFVGVSFFGGQATLDEMLRVIGFAYAPQMLAIIPCIGGLVGAIWSLVAGFIAVRQGLDVDDLQAFLTIVIGFGVYIAGSIIISFIFGSIGAFIG
jgi:hypothetical protein